MHLITGLLLSFLLNKDKAKNRNPLLDLPWPIRTVHLLPGRVRFHVPLMVGQKELPQKSANQLSKINGIKSADFSSITGTFLIYFEGKIIQPDLIYAALIRLLQLEKELEKLPRSSLSREINSVAQALNQAIYAKSNGFLDLKTIIPLALGIIGVTQIVSKKSPVLPTGLTLLWWSYNSLIQNKDGK
jgi:hypothetical protein